MVLQASGQISLQDVIQEFTNSTDGTESITVASAANSGQAVINTGSTAALCVGMRATTIGVNGTIASLTSGSITMSANLSTTLLTGNEIFFEANQMSDFYSGGAIGVSAGGAPNVPTAGAISLTDFYSATAAIDFPASTYIVREFDGTFATTHANIIADDAAYDFAGTALGQGFATKILVAWFRIERTSTGFHFDVYGLTNNNSTRQDYKNSAGTSFAISNAVWTQGASGSVQPESFKWQNPSIVGGTGSFGNGSTSTAAGSPSASATTFNVAENTFQSLTVGQTGGWTVQCSATSDIAGTTEFNSASVEFTVTMRRSGYNDTETLNFVWCGTAQASATSESIFGK